MATDNLVMQGARALAAMGLTSLFSESNIEVFNTQMVNVYNKLYIINMATWDSNG